MSLASKPGCLISAGVVQQPYKSLMVAFCYSAYAAVLQYIVLVPEYAADRPVLIRERDSGLCRMAP